MKFLIRVILLFCLPLTQTSQAGTTSPLTPLSLTDTRHLLERTGFGASPAGINQLLGLSREQAVSTIVNELGTTSYTKAPPWTEQLAPHHWRFANFSTKEKQQFRRLRLNEMQSLRRWWVQEMISTPYPQTERLVLFWHNHFSTAYTSINHQSIGIARQHKMLREQGVGNFRELLKSVIRDPAMLNYLDNNASVKAKPNENLAREIMELFTLGEGNYTEHDVKNAARALTGYSYSDIYNQNFVFKEWNHDDGMKEIFGRAGNFDGDDLIDLILEQPAAAQFVATKFWRMLVSDKPPVAGAIAHHAQTFRESDYDIKTLYKSVLLSDDFWHESNRATIAKSPVSLTVGAIRTTGILPSDWQTLPSKLAQMGQNLFDPPNVAGWPGGGAWITPGRLLTRMQWLEHLTDSADASLTNSSKNPSMSKSLMSMNEMSMQTQSNQAASSGSSMMMQSTSAGREELMVQMASEEFDESAQYRVTLIGDDGVLWNSGKKQLKGGHDTKRMGRIDRKNMPWQQISFPVNVKDSVVNSVEIEFLNDDATADGADRNLFISQVSLGEKTWLPQDGKQTGKCARKKPEQQGNLFCEGVLRISKYTTSQSNNFTPPDEHTMRVSSAHFRYIRPPNRKDAQFVFALSDVEFNDRFWDTMIVRYVKTKQGYTVRMNNLDCWPRCLEQWPECAWTNKSQHKTISVSLTPMSKNEYCMYDDLQPNDQNLVNALWMILDDLRLIATNSMSLKRGKVEENLKKWQPHFQAMQQQLASSAYFDDKISFEILPRPMQDATQKELITTPLPAGLTASQRTDSIEQLRQRKKDFKLSSMLLASSPAEVSHLANQRLDGIVTDLVFQLK